jgi:hypothetical protein
MSGVPSIKGAVFTHCVDKLLKLASSGRISRAELERRLEPGDIEILESPIHATQWYDIRVYERMMRLNRDVDGDGNNEYLVRWGAISAENLLAMGTYQQLDYAKRMQLAKETDPKARFVAYGRDLRLMVSLTFSFLNFVQIEVKVDPESDCRYVLEYSNAAAYPDVLCWTNLGFINRLAAEHGEPDLWKWERPSPDRVVYRMSRSI